MDLYLVLVLTFSYLLTLIQTESDVCGKYAVLTETDRFFISQSFQQKIAIDFADYSNSFNELNPQLSKFEALARNYSTLDDLNKKNLAH